MSALPIDNGSNRQMSELQVGEKLVTNGMIILKSDPRLVAASHLFSHGSSTELVTACIAMKSAYLWNLRLVFHRL